MKNLPRITYGNDFNIKIYMTELVNEEPVPYDLTDCTDVQVQMFCSKHKTMFELPYTIDPNEPSVINAQIDYRLTHPNTMYGFVVSGYDDLEQHFQWCQRPSEGIMVVENSSGAYLDASIDNTIDIAARIGFNLNMSNYYDKGQIDAMFENYYTITDIDTYLAQKQDILVSGTNIKTINNQSILGEGDIEIEIPEQEQADWNESDNTQPDFIKNKPDLSIYAESSDLATVATTGDYDDLSNTPDLSIYAESSDLATVATTGDYDDLSNTPDLSIYAESSDLATVATTGDYDDLSNTPDLSIYAQSSDLATKQDVLVSGTNIKTINNQSLLGEGNITIEAGETQEQADWEQTDDTQVDYIKNKPDFVEPKIEFVEEAPEEKDPDVIYVESPVYDITTTSIDIVNEAPEEVEEGKIVIVSNPIQLKTINNQEIVGEGNIEIQGGGTQIQSDWSQSDNTQVDYIKNKPNLANVATSGSYNDLSNTPNLSNYVTKTNEIDKYRVVVPYVHYRMVNDVDRLNFTVQVYNNVTNELVYQPASGTQYNNFKQKLRNDYGIEFSIFAIAGDIYTESINIDNNTGLPEYVFGINDRKEGYALCSYKSIYDEENDRYESWFEAIERGHVISFVKTYYQKISDVAVSGSYNDLSNTPDLSVYAQSSGLSTVATSGSYNDLSNTPDLSVYAESSDLATVATTGDYTDLSNTPDLSVYAESSDLATVATTGDYTDLSNTPDLTTKQDTLVSGTNIKTINNQSLLGSGNITIQAGGTQIQSDWNQSDNTQVDFIKNKPDLSVYAESSDLATVATSGSYTDLSNTPTIPAAQIQADYNQSDNTQVDFIKNKPDLSIYAQSSNLATVATSGSYTDLSNTPTIPAAQIQADYNQSDNTQVDFIKNKPDLSIYAQSSNLATVATSGSYNDLSNTPTIPAAQIQSDWNQSDNTQKDFIKNKPDLSVYAQSSNLANVATSGSYYDLDNAPILSDVASSGDYNDLINTPNLATVATSGSYTDLSNTPTIPAAQVQSNWNETNTSSKAYIQNKPDLSIYAQSSSLATVATSGSYNDLSNKPTIPAAQVQSNWNETNTSSKAYIQNKPTIPTVPTNVSAFNNDAGYISSIPNTVVTSDTTGLMIKVVNTLPLSPDNNTIYIIQ